MIDLARELGAKVLNFFFLVRTGRGRDLTDIDAAAYERILTYLAKVQGVGDGPPSFVRRLLGMGGGEPAVEKFEDPWSTPVGRADGLLIRAKCAPHFRRILYELNPSSPLLRNYAHGSCPAGKYYCRITPTGDVTPCPYMPVSVGNLRDTGFDDLWRTAPAFEALREPKLGGRCGACEFSKVCGGCRCRAYATHGDFLAEDPACGYQPGGHGGAVIELPATHDVRAAGGLSAHVGSRRARAAAGDPLVRARHGGEGGGGLRARPGGDHGHAGAARRRAREVGWAVPTAGMSAGLDDRFRMAARAYFVYGLVYLVGGLWLWLHDVGRGFVWSVVWILLGATLVVLIPFLLRRPRAWFERWILSRRDFARIVVLFMAFRVLAVAHVVFRSETAMVAAPWGGLISFRLGGAVFMIVTLVALVLVARAAWDEEA